MKQRGRSLARSISTFLILALAVPTVPVMGEELPVVLSEDRASVNASQNISMDFENASLKDILKVFSQLSRLNFVASQDIENKRATVYFDDVPIMDALNGLMSANNLRYEQKKGSKVFVVYSASTGVPTMETKIYPIKYSRLSISPVDVGGASSIGELASTQTVSNTGSGSSATASTSAASGASGNLKTGKGIDNLVAGLLSKHGSVTVDLPSNSLIITDTPEKLSEIEKVLIELDKPAPQVIIEVYLMELQKDVLSNLGVEWGGDQGTLVSLTGGSRTTAFPFGERVLKGINRGADGNAEVALADTPEITLGTIDATGFQAILHYITTLSSTKILAKPRVLTMNNEAASIRLVTNAAVANQVSTSSSESTATQVTNVAEREDVGISLNMTPQINRDGTVVLYIQPSLTTAAASAFFPDDFVDTTTRIVKTVARIKDHETLVIGGLLDNTESSTQRKFPFFGDLPLVGDAFRYKTDNDRDRELVVFITPHIVQGYESRGVRSATSASGRDLQMKRIMDEVSPLEFDHLSDAFQSDVSERERLSKPRTVRSAPSRKEAALLPGRSTRVDVPEITAEADREMYQALQQMARR